MPFTKNMDRRSGPTKPLGLVFDPYCLIASISFCWKLVVLRWITWSMWLYKFCKFYKMSTNFGRALYVCVLFLFFYCWELPTWHEFLLCDISKMLAITWAKFSLLKASMFIGGFTDSRKPLRMTRSRATWPDASRRSTWASGPTPMTKLWKTSEQRRLSGICCG